MARLNHEKINSYSKVRKGTKTGFRPGIKKPGDEDGTLMKAKFAGKCELCQSYFPEGERIYYMFDIKRAFHKKCKEQYSL